MSDIVIHNQFDKLPESLRQYAINRVGKKAIKDLDDGFLLSEFDSIIQKFFAHIGAFDVKSGMIVFQTNELLSEARSKKKHQDLTVEEIKQMFIMGANNELGDFYGRACRATYSMFFRNFLSKPERSEAMRVYLDQFGTGITDRKLTDDQKYQVMKQASLQEFDNYSTTKKLSRSAPYIYDFIAKKYGSKAFLSGEEIYVLISDKEVRQKIKKDAKAEYEETLNTRVLKREIKKKDAEAALFDLVTNRTYLNIAKTIELGIYFDELIKNNQKLIL